MAGLIALPNELDANWLAKAIQPYFPSETVKVESFSVLLTKRLAYSTVARLAVKYIHGTSQQDLPATLFLKLIPRIPNDNSDTELGTEEIEFYRTVARKIPSPPTVLCYEAATSAATGLSHVLMEDLFETHTQPKQGGAPNEPHSRAAVKALAAAHSVYWDSKELGESVGKLFDKKELSSFVANVQESVNAFVSAHRDQLSPKQIGSYSAVLASAESIWARVGMRPGLTVIHGDTHWWNFLFPKAPEKQDVFLIDWHLWHVDRGARDLAFLLALGGFAPPRPELEESLLEDYLEALISNGVTGYTWDDLWIDYRWAVIRNLNIPVIFWKQGKTGSTVMTSLDRAFSSFFRLRCWELLDQGST